MLILVIDDWCISCKIAIRWMQLNLTDDKSTLIQVMAWCRQATSHYLSQCWPRSLSPYVVTRPQRVNIQSLPYHPELNIKTLAKCDLVEHPHWMWHPNIDQYESLKGWSSFLWYMTWCGFWTSLSCPHLKKKKINKKIKIILFSFIKISIVKL